MTGCSPNGSAGYQIFRIRQSVLMLPHIYDTYGVNVCFGLKRVGNKKALKCAFKHNLRAFSKLPGSH